MDTPTGMADPATDALIERWISGDAAAAEEIYHRYYRRAWRFGLALTRRVLDADEIAHEAAALGLEVLRDSRRPEKLTGWILGVVRRKALTRGRAGGAELAREDLHADPDSLRPSQVLVRDEMKRVLSGALDALSREERELVKLRFAGGNDREAIAGEMGISVDTLDRRISKVLLKLRAELSGHFTSLVIAPPGPTREAVDALRPSFRQVILMRHVEELEVPEMARRLNVPEVTVRERLAYAYQQLRCTAGSDFGALRRPI